MRATAASVPLPLIGSAYAWPLPYSSAGITRSAIVFGLVFSRAIAASWSFLRRASSFWAKAGCSTMSAYTSSAAAMVGLSTFNCTNAPSRLVLAAKLAPSASNCSPIASELRLGVPSSSMRSARLATPGKSAESEAKPLSSIIEKLTIGAACRSASTTFKPFDKVLRCMGGKFSDSGWPSAGTTLRSIFSALARPLGNGCTSST